MDGESATMRCRYCGKTWRVPADEYGDHECGCAASREAEYDEDEQDEELIVAGGVTHMRKMQSNWREIVDEREKYAAYLCSREWAELREAVRTRASDACERCKCFPMSACHHLTYARKYNESLDDLQAICQPCHDFTHGKSDLDPAVIARFYMPLIRHLLYCKKECLSPIPWRLAAGMYCKLADEDHEACRQAIEILVAADLEYPAFQLADLLPFCMPSPWVYLRLPFDPPIVEALYIWIGFGSDYGSQYLSPDGA